MIEVKVEMPLVRIDLKRGKSTAFRRAIADQVHKALVEEANVPAKDLFHVIVEHDDGLVYSPEYLGIRHTDEIVIILVTFLAGRTVEVKKALYRRIADLLEEHPGVPRDDVIIGLVEGGRENWSFGRGEAQYV